MGAAQELESVYQWRRKSVSLGADEAGANSLDKNGVGDYVFRDSNGGGTSSSLARLQPDLLRRTRGSGSMTFRIGHVQQQKSSKVTHCGQASKHRFGTQRVEAADGSAVGASQAKTDVFMS